MEPYWTQWAVPPCLWLAGAGLDCDVASDLQALLPLVYASHLQLDGHMSAAFQPNRRDDPSALTCMYVCGGKALVREPYTVCVTLRRLYARTYAA